MDTRIGKGNSIDGGTMKIVVNIRKMKTITKMRTIEIALIETCIPHPPPPYLHIGSNDTEA